jgi:hypothetical protein
MSMNFDEFLMHLASLESGERHQLENSDQALVGVHSIEECKGEYCTIHNMSDHHMRSWPQYWRTDWGFMERICPHGIGHPDPDEYMLTIKPELATVHGCDGCCKKGKND